MSIFDGGREWVEGILQGAEDVARQHANDLFIGGVFDLIFWIADHIRNCYELLFTYVVPHEHAHDLEHLLRSVHEQGTAVHHDFVASTEHFSTQFVGLGGDAYIKAARHTSVMHKDMLDAFVHSNQHHAAISANLSEAAFNIPLLTGGTEVGFGALVTTVATGGTSSPATVPAAGVSTGTAAASAAVIINTLMEIAAAIATLYTIAVDIHDVTQSTQYRDLVANEIKAMITLTLTITEIAAQFNHEQKKRYADAMKQLKDYNTPLPPEVVILLVDAGFTVKEILAIAIVESYLQKYAIAQTADFVKNLAIAHAKYDNVPLRDIIYLLAQGYTQVDIDRILPSYDRLKDKGLQDLFDNGLNITQENISKGADREIATIIAIDAVNVQSFAVKIPDTANPQNAQTDLDIVLNYNQGVIQIGGASRKVSRKDDFDRQFNAAFDYSKGNAILYLQTGPKGKSDDNFQTAYKWIVEDMTAKYLNVKNPPSPSKALELAETYAYTHVRPIGYPYQNFATPDLNNKPYPPNVSPAPGNPYS